MKQFFKMMFASTLGVMLAMGIILTVLISMTIGYIATVGSTPDYTPKSNTVFKIKLDGTLADNPAENPFSALMGDKENMLSLKDLLETIRIAKQNDKIAGIYIESTYRPLNAYVPLSTLSMRNQPSRAIAKNVA